MPLADMQPIGRRFSSASAPSPLDGRRSAAPLKRQPPYSNTYEAFTDGHLFRRRQHTRRSARMSHYADAMHTSFSFREYY